MKNVLVLIVWCTVQYHKMKTGLKYFNLKDHNIDAATSTGGLSNALDKVFTVTGLKKLDQLAKNTTMNAFGAPSEFDPAS